MLPPLVVSLGDPAGVGPELLLKAWQARDAERLPPFLVVEGADVLRQAAARVGLDCPIVRIDDPGEATASFARGLPVLGDAGGEYRPGQAGKAGAELAWLSLRRAIELARGFARGVVTAPVSKAAIDGVMPGFVGQTEAL